MAQYHQVCWQLKKLTANPPSSLPLMKEASCYGWARTTAEWVVGLEGSPPCPAGTVELLHPPVRAGTLPGAGLLLVQDVGRCESLSSL